MRHRYFAWLAVCMVAIGTVGTVAWADETKGEPAKDAAKQAEAPAKDVPKIRIDPLKFDFGTVWVGQPAKGTVTVRNVGTAPLLINDVKSSCGCTTPTRPKSPIAPGAASEFTITYNTGHAGKANKRVTLHTNDPTNAQVVVPVTGEVKPIFKGTPSDHVTFGRLGIESAETSKVVFENQYDKPLELKIKEGQDFGKFDVKLETIEKGRKYELSVTTKPPLQVGFNRARISFDTGDKDLPDFSVNVFANAQPAVFARPFKVYVSQATTQPARHRVMLQWEKDRPIEVTEVTASFGEIEYELKPQPDRRRGHHDGVTIWVTLPPAADIPAAGGKLIIKTNDREERYQTLEVPVARRPQSRPRRGVVPATPRQLPGRRLPIGNTKPDTSGDK